VKEKIRKILNNLFDALPLDAHREYVGTSVDQGNSDIYITVALILGWLMQSWSFNLYTVIGIGIGFHILNFLAWRAEPLHHKAMRHKQ